MIKKWTKQLTLTRNEAKQNSLLVIQGPTDIYSFIDITGGQVVRLIGAKNWFGSDCDVIGGHENDVNMDQFEVGNGRGHSVFGFGR